MAGVIQDGGDFFGINRNGGKIQYGRYFGKISTKMIKRTFINKYLSWKKKQNGGKPLNALKFQVLKISVTLNKSKFFHFFSQYFKS
jgi:hypothetical protein